MNFKIESKFLLGKQQDPLLCEDNVYVGDYFAAVVDGATSKSSFMHNNKKSGKIASDLVVQAIEKFNPDIELSEAISLITQEIYNYYELHMLQEHMKYHKSDRFTACAAIYSSLKSEVWLIGDCQCKMGDNIYKNEKEIDIILSNTRSLFLQLQIEKGASINELLVKDIGREYILPMLVDQNVYQNKHDRENKYAYSVFDGFPICFNHVNEIKVTENQFVLATDGYPKIFDSLVESEDYLNFIINNDPLCIDMYKSTKGITRGNVSYDDRAFLKIKIA